MLAKSKLSFSYSTKYLTFSIINFFIAFWVIFLFFNIETHWRAILYLFSLFFITFIPGLIISRKHKSPFIALLLNPAIIFSFDAFFLRLGIFNYFVYFEGNWHPAITQSVLHKSALYTVFGNLSLWIGYFFPPSNWVRNHISKYVMSWSHTRVKFSEAVVWLIFSIGLFARLFILSNSLGGYFSFDLSAQSESLRYNQYIVILESLTSLSLVVYFVYLLKQGNMANWIKFIFMLGIEFFTVFMMGFKGQVIYRLIYLAIAYIFIRRKFPLQIAILSVGILVIIMPVNLVMRNFYTSSQNTIITGQGLTIIEGAIEAFNIVLYGETEYTFLSVPERVIRQSAQLENFSMAVQYIDRTHNTLNGAELLNFFYGFIPRAIWSSKQIASLGGWFYQEVYGYSSSLTAAAITVPGDLYLNLNWWGVLLGLFFFGYFLRIVYETTYQMEPTMRMASLVPFIIIGLGIPLSEIGSHLNGVVRTTILNILMISIVLLPSTNKKKTVRNLK